LLSLQGFVPKLDRKEIAALSGAQDDARYFQISVPVQPGNSGGALERKFEDTVKSAEQAAVLVLVY